MLFSARRSIVTFLGTFLLLWQSIAYAVDLKELDRQLERFVFHNIQSQERLELGNQLAHIHLSANRYQEAIWSYQRGGNFSEANSLKARIEQSMRANPGFGSNNGRLEPGVRRAGGGTIREIAPGLQVIAKYSDLGWANSAIFELFAYKMDQLLGLNRVPLTISMRDQNDSPYSVQLIVPGESSNIEFRDELYSRRNLEISAGLLDEIFAFDFLTGQSDRHATNSLWTPAGRLALIDNGRSFSSTIDGERHSSFEAAYQSFVRRRPALTPALHAALLRLTPSILRSEFGNLLKPADLNILISRVQTLTRDLNSDGIRCRSNFR